MKNKKLLLSICIPTYNRANEIYEKVSKILSYNIDEVEVVVSDNCSIDNTVELLSSIKNENLVLIKNKENKGAIYNYMQALTHASGQYALFVIDKDFVDFSNIAFVLDYLKMNSFSVGLFDLNYPMDKASKVEEFTEELDCINNFAYLSRHPTGYIFNNEHLKKINLLERYTDLNAVDCFALEFIAADLAINPPCILFHTHFCTTFTVSKQKSVHSVTYSPQNNNIFFSPQARFQQFERYMKHFSALKHLPKNKKSLYKTLLMRTHYLAVNSYAEIMKNEDICHYYQVKSEVVNAKRKRDITKELFKFMKKSKILSLAYTPLQRLKFKFKFLMKA